MEPAAISSSGRENVIIDLETLQNFVTEGVHHIPSLKRCVIKFSVRFTYIACFLLRWLICYYSLKSPDTGCLPHSRLIGLFANTLLIVFISLFDCRVDDSVVVQKTPEDVFARLTSSLAQESDPDM